MDPRRLDSTQIRNILNCEPPKHGITEAPDSKPAETPRLVLNLPRVIDKNASPELASAVNNKQQGRPANLINTKDNPEILQYIPQVPKNATIYIDINIYVVEDDSNTGQTHEPGENVKLSKPESRFNDSPILSEDIRVPEPIRINKMVIPSISGEIKKNTMRINRPLSRNSQSSDSESRNASDFYLGKREEFESQEAEERDDKKVIAGAVKGVKDFWTHGVCMHPITFATRTVQYNTENGGYYGLESVDYSNKMIPK